MFSRTAKLQLSSELFERIVGPHGSPPGPEAPPVLATVDETGQAATPRPSIIMPAGARVVERRQVRRTAFGQRARMCPDSEASLGLWDTVMLQDISVAGVRFLSERWLDVNSLVQVVIEDRTGTPIRLQCVVRRCERGGMGGVWFTVGLTFEALLTQVPGGVAAGAGGGAAEAGEAVPIGSMQGRRAAPASGGLLGRFTPRRLLSALTRNYDDYSTVSLGPPRGR